MEKLGPPGRAGSSLRITGNSCRHGGTWRWIEQAFYSAFLLLLLLHQLCVLFRREITCVGLLWRYIFACADFTEVTSSCRTLCRVISSTVPHQYFSEIAERSRGIGNDRLHASEVRVSNILPVISGYTRRTARVPCSMIFACSLYTMHPFGANGFSSR